MCSWRAPLVPPLIQLVQPSHASSLNSTRVLLARTTCTTVDIACELFARLKSLLDLFAADAHNLYNRRYSLCTLCTPRALTRLVCFWRALLISSLMQFMQSPNASGLYSTRVPWQARTSPSMLQLVQFPNVSGLYSTRFPGRHELPR